MSEIKNHSKAYWTCQILGWGIYGLLNTVFLSAFQTITAQNLGITVFGSVQLLLWTHLLRIIFKKRHWVTLPLWKLFIRVLIADLVIAIISQSIQIFGYFYIDEISLEQFRWKLYGLQILNTNFILWIWSLLYVVFSMFDITKRGEREKWELQTAVKEAELMALKAQINPHFLFNSLNNIRALVIENPERARDMISKLSELFRYALRVSNTRSVLLKEELAVVKNYLLLEATQLEDRLRYRFDIAPETRQVEIPPMTIQTLVENAIRHGIALHPDGGEISIRTTLSACDNAQTGNQQTVMVVCIVNTGQMKNNATNDGIGLQNTRERLHLLFGNTAQLTVENISQNQVCAKFQVPFTGQQI